MDSPTALPNAWSSHFKDLIASHHLAVAICDLGSVISVWNAGAERLLSYAATEMVGRNLSFLFPESERATTDLIGLNTFRLAEIETRLHDKEGSLVDILLTISVHRDAEGSGGQMAIVLQEVTARTSLARDRQRSRRVGSTSRLSEDGREAESRGTNHAGPVLPVVMIVDDNVDFCDSLIDELADLKLELLAAKSGLHAIQVLEQRHVDLVVSDLIMPGIDGVRLLEVVRERWPRCQRVLLTAHQSSDVVIAAVTCGGVSKVLTKSMHLIAIRDEIERIAVTSPLLDMA